jgi:hypothetical protein
MSKGEIKVQTILRLAPEIRKWILEQASSNGRTINGEVSYRLRKMKEQESEKRQA